MAFDGTEGDVIDLTTASAWTANYRNSGGGAIRAHFIGRDILNQILGQEDCMGIRIYYAKDDSGVGQLILVGAGADEEDLYNGIIADFCQPCPADCPQNSPLYGA